MDHLDRLEARSVHILREAYAGFRGLCMLWSIGKDSTVLSFPIDQSMQSPRKLAYASRRMCTLRASSRSR